MIVIAADKRGTTRMEIPRQIYRRLFALHFSEIKKGDGHEAIAPLSGNLRA